MRTLLLLRHAKAEPHESDLLDHARGLTERGLNDARGVGRWLKAQNLVPDAIIASTATRALSTAKETADACGYSRTIHQRSDLYLAPPETYLHVLRGWPDDEPCVLMVGHNNGIQELASALCGQELDLPTAALVHLRFAWPHWGDAALIATGVLADFERPKG